MIELIKQYYPQLPKKIKIEIAAIAEQQALLESKDDVHANPGTLVPLAISIMVKLYEKNDQIQFVASKSIGLKNILINVTSSDIQELAIVIGSANVIDEVEALLIDEVVSEITKEMNEKKATKIITTRLIESIQTIQEANRAPRLGMKLRYHLK